MGTGTSNKGLRAAPDAIPFRQLLCGRGARGLGKLLSLGAGGMDAAGGLRLPREAVGQGGTGSAPAPSRRLIPGDRDAALGDPDTNEAPAVVRLPQDHGCSAALSRGPLPTDPLPSPEPARCLGRPRARRAPADASSARATAPATPGAHRGTALASVSASALGLASALASASAAAAAQRGDSAGRNAGVLHGSALKAF